MYTEGCVRKLSATVPPPPVDRGQLSSPGADTAVVRPQPSEQTNTHTHRLTLIAQRCMKTHRLACQAGVW